MNLKHAIRDVCLLLPLIGCAACGALGGEPCESTTVVLINSADDLEAISDCEVMLGQLTVQGADDIVEFSLPMLREIAGPIHFNGNENLASVRFDALELADHSGIPRAEQAGVAFMLNPKLETVSLPALKTVGSATRPTGLGFSLNPEFITVEVPALERMFGGFGLSGSKVTAVSLPRIERLTSLSIGQNIPLKSVSLPLLETVTGSVGISGQQLQTLELPALRSVGTQGRGEFALGMTGIAALSLPELEDVALSFKIEENHALETIEVGGTMDELPLFYVERNASLTRLELPHVLDIGTLRVQNNDKLEFWDFTDLRRAEYFEVVENPSLSSCSVIALINQLNERDGVRSAIHRYNLEETCGE